jgi:beta-N-acetylhexosaminidase
MNFRRHLLIPIVAILVFGLILWHFSQGTAHLPSPEIIVGQNIITGVQGPLLDEANISFLEKVKPGAVILYKYNIQSDEQLKAFINQLQEIALRTTGQPYLIMIDEEPGGATRLDIYRDAFTGTTPNWDAIRRDTQRLKDLGINVVLSPLADLAFDTKGSVTHRLPLHTAEQLIDFNNRFIAVLKEFGIGATLKHFPGLGLLDDDTHMSVVRSAASTSTIMRSVDLFTNGVQGGADFVMTSHAIYTAIDPKHSATVSSAFSDILKNRVGFKGITITDDITNMPVGDPERMQPYDASIEALRAGHTMVMFGTRRTLAGDLYDAMLKAYRSDSSLRKIFDHNYIQVTEYKKEHL